MNLQFSWLTGAASGAGLGHKASGSSTSRFHLHHNSPPPHTHTLRSNSQSFRKYSFFSFLLFFEKVRNIGRVWRVERGFWEERGGLAALSGPQEAGWAQGFPLSGQDWSRKVAELLCGGGGRRAVSIGSLSLVVREVGRE